MSTSRALSPIHPTKVRLAFGQDRVHQAVLGTIKGIVGGNLLCLAGSRWIEIEIDDPRFVESLNREDLCRLNHELVVLLNVHYGLLALAFGPSELPPRLQVAFGACRIENGAAVEILGGDSQPGWLLFRCHASPALEQAASVE